MEPQNFQRQMSSTHKKEKIFNVRKVHYKQFDAQKCAKYMISEMKPTFIPLKEHFEQPLSSKTNKKGGEYNYQVAIISSSAYKQLSRKYNTIKQEHDRKKHQTMKQLQQKEQQLQKYRTQKQRIDSQRNRIIQRRDQLRMKIQEIRDRNQMLREEQMQRHQQYRIMNMEYLRNMVLGVRYQNGMDIDLDNMTYEEMLQLEEKMGSVSKGLTEEQIEKLQKKIYKQGQPQQLCSICYYNAKENEQLTVLPCKHSFHSDCIKQWLIKQKMCPMCKQQIITKIKSVKTLLSSKQICNSQSQSNNQSIEILQQMNESQNEDLAEQLKEDQNEKYDNRA